MAAYSGFSMSQLLQRILRNNLLLLLCFWLLVAVVYAPAHQAGLFTDIKDTIYLHKHQSFIDFLNRAGLSIKSLYQVTQLILYVILSLFGTHTMPWFLLFITLHALSGLIVCRFFERLFIKFGISQPVLASLVGTLFFLLNPVQAEVVIWKATLHYFLAVFQIFGILHFTLSYTETGRRKYVWLSALVYFISTFTVELFYLTPFFTIGVLLALRLSGVIDVSLFKKTLLRISLLLIVLLGCHMLLYHTVYGKWIPHYNIETETVFRFKEIVGKINKYLFHVYGMDYFLPYKVRQAIYSFSENSITSVVTTAIVVAASLLVITCYRRLKPSVQLALLLFFLALLSFGLVIPLWFNSEMLLYNDRYYYLPSIFLFMLLGVGLLQLRLPVVRYGVIVAYGVACIAGSFYIAVLANKATDIYYALIRNYKWQGVEHVLVLNLPNNYHGIRQIPAMEDGNMNRHLAVFADSSKGRIYDVSSYNMDQKWDGAHVKVMDSMTLKVTLNQWGTWWLYDSYGATSYENELYAVDMTDQGHEYLLKLKSKPQNMVILFQQGEHWKMVNWADTVNEQW